MHANILQERISVDSYGGTTFYLVHNPQDTTSPATNISQTIQSVVNVGDPAKDSLRFYYENIGAAENNILIQKHKQETINTNLKLNLNVDTRKIEYYTHLNNGKPQLGIATNNKNKEVVAYPINSSHAANVNIDNEKSQNNVIVRRVNKHTLLPKKKISKIKPKLSKPNSSEHTSVYLLKVGTTYHSLNNLNEEQTKLVSHAIQNISDPVKVPPKPIYDATTNTRVVYKVVSPNDLKVISKNKIGIGEEATKNKCKEKAADQPKPNSKTADVEPALQTDNNVKMTRSGRAVKLPKYIQPSEEAPPKRKKRTNGNIKCFQCPAEFYGIYQLQRHYEKFPTHIPANVHTNLFHCLLAILDNNNACDKTDVFIQQLKLLTEKLKRLFPCLLHRSNKNDEGKPCIINDDLSRLFGINPGKYNLNMDAIHCVKDENGYCKHNPQQIFHVVKTSDPSKPSQVWLSKHKEEIANNDAQSEDCARTNSVDKWPTFNKRIWKSKQSITNTNEDNNKNVTDIIENIDLCEDNHEKIKDKIFSDTQDKIISSKSTLQIEVINPAKQNLSHSNEQPNEISNNQSSDVESDPSHTPVKFHSTHFDIRSSPFKPTASVFNKIQIRPKNIPKFEMRPPAFTVNIAEHEEMNIQTASNQSLDLPMFKEFNVNSTNIVNTLDSIDIVCKETNIDSMSYNNKEWNTTSNLANDHFQENYTSDGYIDPSMIHIPKPLDNGSISDNNDLHRNEHDMNIDKSRLTIQQTPSVLHLLDTLGNDCLTFPDTELRNNTMDLPLDLFTFNNN